MEHIDFAGSFIVVAVSKTKRPRLVPLSPTASRALRRQIGKQETGSVFKMSGKTICCCLKNLMLLQLMRGAGDGQFIRFATACLRLPKISCRLVQRCNGLAIHQCVGI